MSNMDIKKVIMGLTLSMLLGNGVAVAAAGTANMLAVIKSSFGASQLPRMQGLVEVEWARA